MLFGYHLLVLGLPTAPEWLANSRIGHRCCVDVFPAFSPLRGSRLRPALLAEAAQLPIASKSVDVVVLPHVLEFVAESHALLREVDRVLIPEGHVLIVGFNPFSLWGLWRLLGARRGRTPWDARFLSVWRLRDWLSLLGFDTLSVAYCFYRPPLARQALLEKLDFLERWGARWWPRWGGGYVLLARKRVSTLTPIKPRWRPRRGLVPGQVAVSLFERRAQ